MLWSCELCVTTSNLQLGALNPPVPRSGARVSLQTCTKESTPFLFPLQLNFLLDKFIGWCSCLVYNDWRVLSSVAMSHVMSCSSAKAVATQVPFLQNLSLAYLSQSLQGISMGLYLGGWVGSLRAFFWAIFFGPKKHGFKHVQSFWKGPF